MTTSKNSETEIRIIVPNESVQDLKDYLSTAYSDPREYSFTDTVYEPRGKNWDLSKQYMVLRTWHYGEDHGSDFTLKFALKSYEDGVKSQLFGFKKDAPTLEIAESVLEAWNFNSLFAFKRVGYAYEDKEKDIYLYLEEIDSLGYSLEIECAQGHKDVVSKIEATLGLSQKFEVMEKPALVLVSEIIKK